MPYTVNRRRLLLASASIATVLVCAPGAAAAPRPVQPADLEGLRVERLVKDRVLRGAPSRVSAAGASTQVFSDQHGHRITVTTDVPGLDLQPYAEILAGTLHYDEIESVVVEVWLPEQIAAVCAPDADACYEADDPSRSYRGQIRIPAQHPDLPHVLTHEYGHHVDNQLINLAHLGACGFNSDGSRDWFFERDVEDSILDSGFGCDPASSWDLLLGELYAEDYVSANGFSGWVLPSAQPPTAQQLDALKYDFASPFGPARKRWRPMVGRKRSRFKRLRPRHWTILTLDLKGPRRSDLDLYLYEGRSSRPVERSVRRGSRERIEYLMEPFATYEVQIFAYKKRGRGRLTIDSD
jgi:hypothetical protein